MPISVVYSLWIPYKMVIEMWCIIRSRFSDGLPVMREYMYRFQEDRVEVDAGYRSFAWLECTGNQFLAN